MRLTLSIADRGDWPKLAPLYRQLTNHQRRYDDSLDASKLETAAEQSLGAPGTVWIIAEAPHPVGLLRATAQATYYELFRGLLDSNRRAQALRGLMRRASVVRNGWSDLACIQDVWVSPDARRQGIGRALLRRAGEELASRGCVRLWLQSYTENEAAHALWQAAGLQRQREIFVASIANLQR